MTNNKTVKISELMSKRRSAKEYNINYNLNDNDLSEIIESIRMSPSCHNLMNLKLLIIHNNTNTKKNLVPIFYNQKNFITSSVTILFVVDKKNKILESTINTTANKIFNNNENIENKNKYISNVKEVFINMDESKANCYSSTSAYIAAGVATVTASNLNIDSCILKGFNSNELDKYLIKNKFINDKQTAIISMSLGKSITKPYSKVKMNLKDFAQEI